MFIRQYKCSVNKNKSILKYIIKILEIIHKLYKDLKNPNKNLLREIDVDLRKATMKSYDLDAKLKQLEIEKSKKLKNFNLLRGSLRERRVILPSNITILKEEIKKRELKVKGPIIDFLRYDDKLSYAIESVLGEKLLYSFIADNWDSLNLLKRLKTSAY